MAMVSEIFYYLISFIGILTLIVFIHEFGHYAVAKLFRVKVTDFSIGFGKKLYGIKDKSGTEWKICLWPLGGYVKMFGDEDPSSSIPNKNIKKIDEHLTFYNKPLLVKSAIVSAGPLANFALGITILTFFFFTYGKIKSSNEITMIAPNSRAEQADFKIGDKIISVDGFNVTSLSDIGKFVISHPDIALQFKIQRGEQILTKTVTPEAKEVDENGSKIKIGQLGVATNKVEHIKMGILSSIKEATYETFQICYLTLKAIGEILKGTRGTEAIGGPIQIAKMSGESVKMGLYSVLFFIAMLSINLGFINLLPIPALDGGHLLFYVVEAILGKGIANKIHQIAIKVGFALLISLMIFVIINDIKNL